jgi:hypothetical protein
MKPTMGAGASAQKQRRGASLQLKNTAPTCAWGAHVAGVLFPAARRKHLVKLTSFTRRVENEPFAAFAPLRDTSFGLRKKLDGLPRRKKGRWSHAKAQRSQRK